jgi:hypothetical protein
MDGLACAALLCAVEDIDQICLVHPQEVADGVFAVQEGDLLANVPYHPKCSKWFDHHAHTATPTPPPEHFEGAYGDAPSAARLIYEYYGGDEKLGRFRELVRETDRVDSARLEMQDVLSPQRYVLLGFTVDGRTGLGPVDDYFSLLVELLGRGTPIESVLSHPSVAERCERMKRTDADFREALLEHSKLDGNVVFTDFRSYDPPPVGNRFLVYCLFPEANVSARVHWGPQKRYPILVLGHNIFNRSCRADVGEIAARYGGGGHRGAASIPLIEEADFQIRQIVAELKARG